MSSIRVKWQNAHVADGMLSVHRVDMSGMIASVRNVKSNRCMTGRNFTSVYRALDKVISDMEEEKRDIKSLQDGLDEILKTYATYETRISGQVKGEAFEEVNVTTENSQGGDGSENPPKKNPFTWTWKDTWGIIGKGGIIGAGVSAIGNLITGKWSTGYEGWKTAIGSGKSLLTAIGGVSSTIAKGANAEWAKSLFGLNNGLSGLAVSSFGKTFKSSLGKQFADLSFKNATTVGDKIKVATKWGGHLLTVAGNVVDNLKEFNGKVTGRMIGETVVESAVDIGVGVLATAGVSAAATATLTALGVTVAAPAVAIGAGAAAVTWAANGICKWATGGKDIGEVASDLIFDTIAPAVGDGVKKVKEGIKTITSWGKKLFSFA